MHATSFIFMQRKIVYLTHRSVEPFVRINANVVGHLSTQKPAVRNETSF